MKEKKARVEDALHACRAAVEEGILPGGGVAVLRAHEGPGQGQVRQRRREDRRGHRPPGPGRPDQADRRERRPGRLDRGRQGRWSPTTSNFGYNALTGKYGDLVKAGVIVPTKVERIALQNAASVAGLLLTTDAIVSEIPEKKKKGPPRAAAGMEDMY